ncbi:MAG: FAD-dependent monooxygenase [Bacteroidetes bacterium]|nr:FAD-dependent monooxygenase [Bacteroidota bacterium]
MIANKNFTIVGAGLVGSLLSIYLAKRGYKVTVYERRPDLRKNRMSAGRSINLALSDRGWRGLEGVGIDDEVRKIGIPMKGRTIHNLNPPIPLLKGEKGGLTFQPYGKDHQANYSVSRGGLNCLLMDIAEKHDVKFLFNEKCTHVDLKTTTASFENFETKKISEIKSDRIFGTDGVFSAARMALQTSTDRFTYSQSYLDHGYKELTIAATKSGDFAMSADTLHIWPRGNFMLIALPNLDKTFTCTLFFPFEGEISFASLDTKEKMLKFFNEMFADAVALMPTLAEDYFANAASSLATIRCFPWSFEDKLLLLGDAAHGIVPFFGQGMNCGFEDCVVLDGLIGLTPSLSKGEGDWTRIFKEFETLRKPDGDAIAELAIENYIEMRDKVADPKFLLQKKIEACFSEKHPDKWTPLYAMVTYRTDMRYSEALSKGKRQEEIMKKIMAMKDIEKKWDSEEVEKEILKMI